MIHPIRTYIHKESIECITGHTSFNLAYSTIHPTVAKIYVEFAPSSLLSIIYTTQTQGLDLIIVLIIHEFPRFHRVLGFHREYLSILVFKSINYSGEYWSERMLEKTFSKELNKNSFQRDHWMHKSEKDSSWRMIVKKKKEPRLWDTIPRFSKNLASFFS